MQGMGANVVIYSEVYQSFPISIAGILPIWSIVFMNCNVTNSGIEVSHDGYHVRLVNFVQNFL
jgi:hypothetical protein